MVKDIQEEILRLKKENDVCILAHAYQSKEITEVADFVGDSYALSVKAKDVKNKTVVMCGVRFMAETVKLLSPDKKVILSNAQAGCPMAEQFDKQYILELKKKYPDYAVVCYVNTTTDLKTVCDVCVTSASAVKIVKNMDNKNIIFIPDINLGSYIAKQVPEANIVLVDGGCPVHSKMTANDVKSAKALHKDALFLVHPECPKEVSDLADYVGSTTGIMKFAKESDKKEFIIGTENSIVELLQYECRDKKFYPLSKNLICSDMKLTTLPDVLDCVKGVGGEEIKLDSDTISKAVKCIDKMIELG